MWCRGTKVWVAQATKNSKDGVVGRLVMEKMIGYTVFHGRRCPPVEQKHSGRESLHPIGWGHGCINQKCANGVVQGAKHALSFAVLSRCVGARDTEKNLAAGQEGSGGIVDELGPIICVKTAYRKTELCVRISNKLNNMSMNFRFMTKRNNVYNHQLSQDKFIARNTQNWRGPNITMNEFKRC